MEIRVFTYSELLKVLGGDDRPLIVEFTGHAGVGKSYVLSRMLCDLDRQGVDITGVDARLSNWRHMDASHLAYAPLCMVNAVSVISASSVGWLGMLKYSVAWARLQMIIRAFETKAKWWLSTRARFTRCAQYLMVLS